MRTLTIMVPSNTVRMTLEDGSEHDVKGMNRRIPYVQADGVKYPLTPDEARLARDMKRAFRNIFSEKL